MLSGREIHKAAGEAQRKNMALGVVVIRGTSGTKSQEAKRVMQAKKG